MSRIRSTAGRMTDPDAILVVHWFEKKKTKTTPKRLVDLCIKRLGDYDRG